MERLAGWIPRDSALGKSARPRTRAAASSVRITTESSRALSFCSRCSCPVAAAAWIAVGIICKAIFSTMHKLGACTRAHVARPAIHYTLRPPRTSETEDPGDDLHEQRLPDSLHESSKISNHADCQYRASTSLLAQRRRSPGGDAGRGRRGACSESSKTRRVSVVVLRTIFLAHTHPRLRTIFLAHAHPRLTSTLTRVTPKSVTCGQCFGGFGVRACVRRDLCIHYEVFSWV